MHVSRVKILSKDGGASGDALCLHVCGISVPEEAEPVYTHITAEIAALGWKQIVKGPWVPHQSKYILNPKKWGVSRAAECWGRTVGVACRTNGADTGWRRSDVGSC